MELLRCSCRLIEQGLLEPSQYAAALKSAHDCLHQAGPGRAWLCPTLDQSLLEQIKSSAAQIRRHSSALLCLGVGGSYLGLRGAWQMLAKPGPTKLLFGGWNSSARYHRQLLSRLTLEEDISLCLISKQGQSAEPLRAFDLATDYLRQRYGPAWRNRVYVITGPENSLRAQAEQEGYQLFLAPPEVPGRYSVLTVAGLLPLAVGGINVEALLEGAMLAAAELNQGDILANPCYQYAAASFHAHQALGKTVELFSVTEPAMSYFVRWLKQLFAESEGKAGRGIFPAEFLYSSDLHTLGQFLAAGNPICFQTLIYPQTPSPAELSPQGYHQLEQGLYSLLEQSPPLHRIMLSDLDEGCLGYGFYFFMKAAALRALLFGNNPFDQPAVESFKRELYQAIRPQVPR